MNRLPRKIKATVKRRPLRVAFGTQKDVSGIYASVGSCLVV